MKQSSHSMPGAQIPNNRRPNGPIVTIGMPVFNGAPTVRIAIAAVLAQTFQDFALIISDNASTDETVQICEPYTADPRIRLLRQPYNLGAVENFRRVLEAANSPYFMFAAADDRIEPHFLEESLSILESNLDAVGCAPRTKLHFSDGRIRDAIGTYEVKMPAIFRPAYFLLRPADNSRFYGLYRTDVMRRAMADAPQIHGIDWAISAMTLSEGNHLRSHSVLLHREGAPPGKYQRLLKQDRANIAAHILPVGAMSALLLRRLPAYQRPFALASLIVLNSIKVIEYLHSSLLPAGTPNQRDPG